jgi:hypothetical protein
MRPTCRSSQASLWPVCKEIKGQNLEAECCESGRNSEHSRQSTVWLTYAASSSLAGTKPVTINWQQVQVAAQPGQSQGPDGPGHLY